MLNGLGMWLQTDANVLKLNVYIKYSKYHWSVHLKTLKQLNLPDKNELYSDSFCGVWISSSIMILRFFKKTELDITTRLGEGHQKSVENWHLHQILVTHPILYTMLTLYYNRNILSRKAEQFL